MTPIAAQPFSVSEVQIIPIKPRDGLIGFASCVLNNALYLGCIAVHTRPDGSGIRLVYPSQALVNGKQVQVFHPISRAAGDFFEQAVAARMAELRCLL